MISNPLSKVTTLVLENKFLDSHKHSQEKALG
jgi:hypothetical protein